jgi:hypothetical protein
MNKLVERIATVARLKAEQPSPVRALAVAIPIGISAGVLAYRVMRSAE